MQATKNYRMFWIGLCLILGYWWSVHPLGFSIGYAEDFCADILRQMMSENIDKFGGPTFHSDSFMAPTRISMPYMSWAIERDWLGAYVWKWNPKFPFLWVYYGLSMLLSYIGVGFILKSMKLHATSAWALATVAVLFHIPRHFKTWHHIDYLMLHWLYLSLFLDAWIWQNFYREKKWIVSLDSWRGVLLLGGFMTTGYLWGLLILEWALVRICLILVGAKFWKEGQRTAITLTWKNLLIPSVLMIALIALELRWFLPLSAEVQVAGGVYNNIGWFARIYHVFRPVWLDAFLPIEFKMYSVAETIVTLGWLLWVPFILSLYSTIRKTRGRGLLITLPFLFFILFGYFWQSRFFPISWMEFFQKIVPFLSFFRVATRWSIALPICLSAVIALCWPELSTFVMCWAKKSSRFRWAIGVFLISSLVEAAWLLHPVNMMPQMPKQFEKVLDEIRAKPEDGVLDLPFCVAGGNGVCTSEQCPNYPYSTTGMCLRAWHHKKVHGLYQSRMNESHCQIYRRAPYGSWFSAWREQRCFREPEWKEFCSYLDQNPQAAILLYQDIWYGAKDPACMNQFYEHLGRPLQEVLMPIGANFGGNWEKSQRVIYFNGRCLH